MRRVLFALILPFIAGLTLSAGDLPADLQAKFIALLCKSANSAGRIAITDAALKAELAKVGVNADAGASVAWGSSEAEVKSLKAAKKLVICGKLDQLPAGGAVAIVEEGGKPQIYLHMGNVAASGVQLADSILKIGKKL